MIETKFLKKFGHRRVSEPKIYDLKKLESEGINIEYNNTIFNLKGTVCFFVADNLESNAVGGFVESFNAKSCKFFFNGYLIDKF
jgi:hypothetical protein